MQRVTHHASKKSNANNSARLDTYVHVSNYSRWALGMSGWGVHSHKPRCLKVANAC